VSVSAEEALAALQAQAAPARAAGLAAHLGTRAPCLGTPNAVIADCAARWRAALPLAERLALAEALWESGVHEARLAAAKLLTQARMGDDAPVWQALTGWLAAVDNAALADALDAAGARRVMADLARLDSLEGWSVSPHLWTRRAALGMTRPLAKLAFPKAAEQAARARVLGWAEAAVSDRAPAIQSALAGWLRDLAKHDAESARAFLEAHAATLKPATAKAAARQL
jgi:3-methyladenine DNA glycosylase AlkD